MERRDSVEQRARAPASALARSWPVAVAAPLPAIFLTTSTRPSQLVQSLIGIVQNAASPDALEAQNIILRRIALQGDVIGSRIPPPRNISEIGGYLNLLSTLKENAMREQTWPESWA